MPVNDHSKQEFPAAGPRTTPAATATGLAITVNGDLLSIASGTTAFDVIESLGLVGRPLAVEVNETVVPRARLAECMLSSGDRLEIVTLVGGG